MKTPEIIPEDNLSYAWGRAFLIAKNGSRDLMPLTISIGITGGLPTEDIRIREAVDAALAENGKCSCAISAMTIFPFKYWKQTGRPHIKQFTDLYLTNYLPRLRARDRRNRTGTYFERMIAFEGINRRDSKETRNQLEHIVSLWPANGGGSRPRQSALQIAIFDPAKDHNRSPRSVFPCLQQVSLAYDDSGGLAINAYYPAQYVFDRAYGNYFGLCHLGHFMAHELDLEFVRLNCFVGRPELGDIRKDAVRKLEEIVRDLLPAGSCEPTK